jgi:hypothetical protein
MKDINKYATDMISAAGLRQNANFYNKNADEVFHAKAGITNPSLSKNLMWPCPCSA